MSDISYKNTEYLSLSFHDISEKKKGGVHQEIFTARIEQMKIQQYL